jgi:ferritin-like metal-binding protein YciE
VVSGKFLFSETHPAGISSNAEGSTMKTQDAIEVIKDYLQDAIAAERSFEMQLRAFAAEANDRSEVRELFEQHADETRDQHLALTERLRELNGSPSGLNSFLALLFNTTPAVAKTGHEQDEKITQNLMIAFAVENSEVAMYESLATVASAAGDGATENLARRIQNQERATAEKVWRQIAPAARRAAQIREAA